MSRSSSYYLLTAFGKDRPGIVAAVTRMLFDWGANIEDASMTRLGGEFTIMLVTSIPTKVTSAALKKGVGALESKLKLDVTIKPISADEALRKKPDYPQYMLSVYGTDHPGIVADVTQALSKRKISVTDLQTKVTGGDKPVYVMLLELAVPASTDMDAVRGELDDLRQKLNVEISLHDIEPVAL